MINLPVFFSSTTNFHLFCSFNFPELGYQQMDNNNGLINNALDDDIEIMARPPEIILISSTSDESDITKVLTNEERNRNYCNNSTRSLSLASLEFPEPPNFSEIRQTILSALPNTSNSNNNEERDASLSRNEISENLQNLEKPLQVGQKRKKLKTRGERSRARSNASKRAASSDSEEEPDQTTHKSKKRLRILPIHNTSSDSDVSIVYYTYIAFVLNAYLKD